MTGGLDVLKTSDEDLLEDGVISDVDDEAALVAAMRSLVERSAITHLVVTRGAKPALALSAGRLAARKSAVEGKRVSGRVYLGGRRPIKKKNYYHTSNDPNTHANH